MSASVAVNRKQCMALAELLKQIPLPPAQEERFGHAIPQNFVPNFYFTIVAICHQTQSLAGAVNGRKRRGWDYLREKWMDVAAKRNDILTPRWLARARAKDVERVLEDAELGSTITDIQGRTRLLNDLGKKMLGADIVDIGELWQQNDGWLAGLKNKHGLIAALSAFRAYGKDPVHKKLLYFLILMKRYCGWKYRDPENLGPPVDYHELRGHLRIGTVKILDPKLETRVRQGTPLTEAEDVTLRKAVFDAIMIISRTSNILPEDLHYNFWNIFRNCCRRDAVHCISCTDHPALPERYLKIVPNRCIFAEICASAGLPIENQLSEPVVDTEYY